VQLFFGNAVVLLCGVVLADLGWNLRRHHALSGILLILLAGMGVILPLFQAPHAGQWVAVLGMMAVLLVCGGMVLRRQMPLRVHLALPWLGCIALLSQLYSLQSGPLPLSWNAWLKACLEILIVFTPLVIFWAWGLPLKSASLQEALTSFFVVMAFALLFAMGGYALTSAVLSSVGLTLFLPLWIYSLAGFLLVITILAQFTSPDRHIRGLALLLYAIAGFSFLSSENILLTTLALTFLTISYPLRTRGILADWIALLSEKVPGESPPKVQEGIAT